MCIRVEQERDLEGDRTIGPLGADPEAAGVHREWSAHSEVGPQETAATTVQDLSRHSSGEGGRMGGSREGGVRKGVLQDQRNERGPESGDFMTHLACEIEAKAIASTFGKSESSGRDDHTMSVKNAVGVFDSPPIFLWMNRFDSMIRPDFGSERFATRDQCVDNGSSPVAFRKELSGGFLFQSDPHLLEPVDGVPLRKFLEQSSNNMKVSLEIVRRCGAMGDVAPPASRNQDLGADLLGPFQKHDSQDRICLCGKDAGGQPCRPRSDDCEIEGVGILVEWRF